MEDEVEVGEVVGLVELEVRSTEEEMVERR